MRIQEKATGVYQAAQFYYNIAKLYCFYNNLKFTLKEYYDNIIILS